MPCRPSRSPTRSPSRHLYRRQLLLAMAAASLLGPAGTAFAQGAAPLKLVITFPPGGSTDIAARILQPRLGEVAGRSVIVENRPGAASQIATQYVAKSAPDGNTLLFSFDTHAINPIAKSRLPYDTFKDFTGVSLALRFPLVIGASASVPAKDLAGFLELARRNPGKYSYASSGTGGIGHLQTELFKSLTGTFITHIPYRGAGPALNDTVGGQVPIIFDNLPSALPFIRDGRLIAIVVAAPERVASMPNVPTFKEVGLEAVNRMAYYGLIGPKGMPKDVVDKIHAAALQAVADPAVKKRIEDTGSLVVANTPAQFAEQIKAEFGVYKQVVDKQKLKLD